MKLQTFWTERPKSYNANGGKGLNVYAVLYHRCFSVGHIHVIPERFGGRNQFCAEFHFDKQFSVVCLDLRETELQFSGNV